MFSTFVFLLVLSVLILVHEWGHFLVARLAGVRVEKFSIGFGPVLFSRKRGETEFCVSLLPLGGFVKLAGESPEDAKGMPWEFAQKPALQKLAIVLAGPFMNAFLAFALFAGIFVAGEPVLTSKIGGVLEGMPAKEAGIQEGDRILAINGKQVAYWEEVLGVVRQGGEKITFTMERNGAVSDVSVIPRMQGARIVHGKRVRASLVGIAPSRETVTIRHGFFESIYLGAERVVSLTGAIFYSLKLVVTGAVSFKDSLTGPIGIFFMTREAAQMGWVYLLHFMGILSVSLFVLNLLPIPVLDGGHVLFLAIEGLKGSPLSDSIKERLTQGGLVFLLALMAYVIFQDVQRFPLLQNIRNLFGGR